MAVRISILTTYNGAGTKKAMRDLALMEKQATLAGAGVTAGMLNASGGMTKFGSSVATVGGGMSKWISLPLVAVAAVSVKMAADFETSMNQVQSAAGASSAQMEGLSKYALKMGADTMFSSGEAAQGMLELAKGGMGPAAIKAGGLKAALDLAAAGNMLLADSANVTVKAMGMFNLKAKDAGSIAAALAGGANASTASVESMALALSQVGPGATNAGLSLQETVAALAAFANKGIEGSDAGTSLKTMLTHLVPSTDKARDMMEKLGLSFVDGKGRIDNITEVAQKLKDKLGPLSEEQRTLALNTIFGSDASRAATVLMGEGATGIQKYITATSDGSAATDMATARTKGLAGQFETLKGSLETAGIGIGTILIPPLTDLAKWGAELVNKFLGLDKGTQSFIVKAGLLAAALGPALSIVGKMTSTIGTLVGTAGKLSLAFTSGAAAAPAWARGIASIAKALASFVQQAALAIVSIARQAAAWAVETAAKVASTVATIAASVATKAAAAAQWLLNAALSANPIGLIVIAIAALVGGFILLWNKCDWFRNFWIGAWEQVKAVAAAVWPAIKAVGEKIVAALQWAWDTLSAAISWFWGWAGDFITAAVKVWWTQIKATVTTIVAVVAAAWDAITAAVSWFWGWAGPFITTSVKLWWTVIKATFTMIVAVVSAAWDAITAAVKWFWDWAGPFITAAVKGWWTVIKATFETIKTVVSVAWDAIKLIVSVAIDAVVAAIHAVQSVVAFLKDVWDRVRDATKTAFDAVVSFVSNVGERVMSAIHSVGAIVAYVREVFASAKEAAIEKLTALVAWASGLGSKVKNAVGNLAKLLYSVGEDIVSGLLSGITDAWHWITEKLSSLISGLSTAAKKLLGISSPSTVFADIGTSIGEGLAQGIEATTLRVADAAGKLAETASKKAREAARTLRGVIKDLTGTIAGGVDLWNPVTVNAPTKSDLSASMSGNLTVMQQWTRNLDLLRHTVGMTPALMAKIAAQGVGSAGEVAALVNMSTAEITAYASQWQQIQDLAAHEAGDQITTAATSISANVSASTAAVISAAANIEASTAAVVSAAGLMAGYAMPALGGAASSTGPGASRSVVIAAGAVQVTIGSGASGSLQDITSAARSGIEPALARLAVELQHL